MFRNLVPVSRERHAELGVRPIESFAFAREFHLASLMAHEFTRAAAVYPIVFIEDADTDAFRPIALLGLNVGENLFVADDGKWQASYIPAIIRRYPFALARSGQQDQYTVCIDEDSPLVTDDVETGQRLFGADGEPGEVMERVKRYLGELQQMERFTRDFCGHLASQNLLNPLNLRVRAGTGLKNITGCYVVNEERLNALGQTAYLGLREKGYMAAIYAHLTSLAQIERLSKLGNADQQLH